MPLHKKIINDYANATSNVCHISGSWVVNKLQIISALKFSFSYNSI